MSTSFYRPLCLFHPVEDIDVGMGEPRGQLLVEDIRAQCMSKGLSGIKGLAVLFRGLDRDYSKKISFREFGEGMSRYGINIEQADIKLVFSHFDKDHNGHVDFAEFLFQLRPPLKQCRIDVINEAFDKLDAVKDNILKIEDLKSGY